MALPQPHVLPTAPPRAPQKRKCSEKRPRQNYDPCPAVSALMRGHESNTGRWNERRESGWPRLPAQGDDSASTMQISWGKCFSKSLRRTVLLPLTRAMRKEGVRASSSRNVFDLDTIVKHFMGRVTQWLPVRQICRGAQTRLAGRSRAATDPSAACQSRGSCTGDDRARSAPAWAAPAGGGGSAPACACR